MTSSGDATSLLDKIREAVSSKTEKHNDFNLEKWLYYAETRIRTAVDDVVCHLTRYNTEDGRAVFILSDNTMIISPMSLKDNLMPSRWTQSLYDYSTIADVFDSAHSDLSTTCILLCSDLEKRNLIIRFD